MTRAWLYGRERWDATRVSSEQNITSNDETEHSDEDDRKTQRAWDLEIENALRLAKKAWDQVKKKADQKELATLFPELELAKSAID